VRQPINDDPLRDRLGGGVLCRFICHVVTAANSGASLMILSLSIIFM
jgi:hypothetical protein